ncbi:MAG: CotH kinase family protein [Planctomycetota bacterium]
MRVQPIVFLVAAILIALVLTLQVLEDRRGERFDSPEPPPERAPAERVMELKPPAVPIRSFPDRGRAQNAIARDRSLSESSVPVPATASNLQISEVCASNRSLILDENGDTSDWIELYNPSSDPVDVRGVSLSLGFVKKAEETQAKRKPWPLPPIVIPPRSFQIVWASGDNRHGLSPKSVLHSATLRFRNTVIPLGAQWRFVVGGSRPVPSDWMAPEFDDSAWPSGASGFGYDDGDDRTIVPEGTRTVFIRKAFQLPDPARVGQLILRVDYDDGFAAYLNGTQLARVNSPVEHPVATTTASEKREAGKPESYELNPKLLKTGRNVLAIVGINDSPSTDMSLLPQLGTLPFTCHTDFRLPKTGAEVVLRDAHGAVIDRAEYPALSENTSWGRPLSTESVSKKSSSWGCFISPTPGEMNRSRIYETVPTGVAQFDPIPGEAEVLKSVRVLAHDASEGVQVGWTSNFRAPLGPTSVEPVRLDRNLLFRAATFLNGERLSPVVSATFLRTPSPHLPVLSISMDPAEFRRIQLGVNGHGRDYESHAFLEFFDKGGKRSVATGVGFRLHGGYGRKGGYRTKKSYRLYFRRFYGDRYLNREFIPGASVETQRRIVLRANFNDRLGAYAAHASFLRDQVLRDLHQQLGSPVARGTWCLLYVNLEYRGLYNALERLDEDFLQRNFGGKKWDMVKSGNEVVCGTRDSWDALRDLVNGKTLGRAPTLAELEREVDLDNFTSYVLLNLWAQNQDWPQNNWYAARRRVTQNDAARVAEGKLPPSKWVFLSWDAEWGMGLNPQGWTASSFQYMSQTSGRIRNLFLALWNHAAYREKFRIAAEKALSGVLARANVEDIVDRHTLAIRPVIEDELRQLARRYRVSTWENNAQVVRDFARLRNRWFQTILQRAVKTSLGTPGQ